MKDTNNIWLLVGRETEGNNTKNYILMDYNGCTQFVQKRSIVKFCREHEVINVQLSGDSITGRGIAITSLPRYTKQQGFGLQQVSGMSQNEVIQMAQPLINQYMQKKEAAQQRKEANSPEAQKAKQNEYVVNKLIIIEDLIVTALAMKDITNELASSEHITRYIKQIDIDNAEGDSLTSLITRNGVNGLATGLLLRLDKLNDRVTKYNLDKSLRNHISKLKSNCNDIKKLHERTKKIIKDNKSEDSELEKQPIEIADIPIIDDVTDMIEVASNEDSIPIVEGIEAGAIEVEYSESSEIASIEDIFKQEQPSKEDKEIIEKVDKLCEVYSRAVTTIGNIIHNPKRVAEIAHALDMEYPGVHKKLTAEKINTSFETEEELIAAISEHYDKLTNHTSNIWNGILDNHLGKAGNEIANIIFNRKDSGINDERLTRNQELFEYYMQTLIDKIVSKLNEDKLQCIENSKQKFTRMSSAKREKMLEDVFGDSWYRAGNSLEEYGSSGWGGWTADDERNKAKRDTLAQYAGLSDEEFMQRIEDVKLNKEIRKRAKILVDAFPEEIGNIYLANHGVVFGEGWKIPNYDRGQSRHREKIDIADELLRTTKSEFMSMTYSEFESAMKGLRRKYEDCVISNLNNLIDNITSSINNLTIDDIANGTYRNIYGDIESAEEYSRNIKQDYGVYLFNNNPLDKVNLNEMLRNKEKQLRSEHERMQRAQSKANNSLFDDFDDFDGLFRIG